MTPKKTILIVEDEQDLVSLLKIRFEGLGFDVVCAPDGQEALTILEKENPDLIILDIMLPEMDGMSALLKIKANNQTKDIPVVVLSAITQEEEVNIATKLGAADYIKKPFVTEDLVARIQEILK